MIDITKDDFKENFRNNFIENESYLEIEKAPKKKNKLRNWVSKNKFMVVGATVYVAIATINMFLVYYFFKLFSKL